MAVAFSVRTGVNRQPAAFPVLVPVTIGRMTVSQSQG
jgi:hypothetical protein